ncbi:MAG: NADP-dependent oxidoreductase, partial [Burkholderiales bacterium]
MNTINKQVTLASRPVGFPKESDFQLVESPIPTPAPGQFLVRSLYLSVDPYIRPRIGGGKSYARAVEIGEVIVGGAVGQVVESSHTGFAKGTIVVGDFGWQQFALSDGAGVRKVDPTLAPISTALSVLGITGLTAYFGLID